MNNNKPTRYVIDVTWTADVWYDETLVGAPLWRLASLAMTTGQLDVFEAFGEGLEEEALARGLSVPSSGATAAPIDWLGHQGWHGDGTGVMRFQQYDVDGLSEETGDEVLITTRLCLWDQVASRWLTGMDPDVAMDFQSEPGVPSGAPKVELPKGRHLWCKIRDVHSCVCERPDLFENMIAH